jgi:hypothetical protein
VAAGLRVYVHRPPPSFAQHSGTALPLTRNPQRLPPPELEADLPSALEPHVQRQAIIIDPPSPPSQYRVIRSSWQLVAYLTTWLRLKLTGRLTEERHAFTTRQLFERLSGVWIKVGQVLSLRGDLISEPMAREPGSLRLHGMLDRLTYIRIIVLTFLSHGVLPALLLVTGVFMFELFFSNLPDSEHWHLLPDTATQPLTNALRAVHPLHRLMVAGIGMFLYRLPQVIRHAIARPG